MFGRKGSEEGKKYEQRAAKHLKQSGIKIIATNQRYREGEIDIICTDSDYLIFVEVKKRAATNFAQAIETITASKISKLKKAAQHFLVANPKYQSYNCRFDVIAFQQSNKGTPAEIQWIKNAFY